jgi:hypothetical protein
MGFLLGNTLRQEQANPDSRGDVWVDNGPILPRTWWLVVPKWPRGG